MAELKTIITLRQGTTAQWLTSNVRLRPGELGLEYLENGSVKIKAGILGENNEGKLWNELPYINNETENILTEDNLSIDIDENTLSLYNYGKVFYKYNPAEKNETGEIVKEAYYTKTEVSELDPWKENLEPRVTTENDQLVIGWFEPNPTVTENINIIQTNIDNHTNRIEALEAKEESVLGVSTNDKILTLNSDKLINATVSMSYDTENKAIKLYGKDNIELGSVDATPFIKDGMLNDVEYNPDNNTLVFTWNTDSGTKTDEVILSDIIEPYIAGTGLELINNEFAIKTATDSEAFLTVNTEGIKVSGIQQAINEAKQAAIDDAATKYVTTGVLNELQTAVEGRLTSLESIDHTLFATKTELEPISTAAFNAETAVSNLEKRFDEIVSEGGEPNAINKIQVNGTELAITDKTVNIEVPSALINLEGWTELDNRIIEVKNQADKGVTDAANAQTTADQALSAGQAIDGRLTTVETFFKAVETPDETIDTLAEIVKYIEDDKTAASGMLASINANTVAIEAINSTTDGILVKAQKYADEKVAAIPTATEGVLGLIKYDNATIKKNDSDQLYVAQVSTDALVNGSNELILNGGSANA